ncbi:MAG: hypothetical protein WC867_03215 [Candidatus Pacearchaeota archaeon]
MNQQLIKSYKKQGDIVVELNYSRKKQDKYSFYNTLARTFPALVAFSLIGLMILGFFIVYNFSIGNGVSMIKTIYYPIIALISIFFIDISIIILYSRFRR